MLKLSTNTDSTATALSTDSNVVIPDTIASVTDTSKADTTASLMSQLGKKEGDTTTTDSSAAANKSFQDFARENPLFAVLAPAIQQNEANQTELRKGPVIGSSLTKDTARVNEIM